MKKRGFVTIATGNIKYHKMANILLKSYRVTSKNPMPFAIITDKKNKYTELFDDVIIDINCTGSYMDKLELLINSPYDETIFIDADCIAFNDLNKYWTILNGENDFSCFGNTYPIDSKKGFFDSKNITDYSTVIKKEIDLHGGIYYIRKGEICNRMYLYSKDIIKNYSLYKFRKFNKPADEPILALTMAIENINPVIAGANDFAWKKRCSNVKANFFKNELSYDFEGSYADNGLLMHFGTSRTIMPLYVLESKKVNFKYKKNRSWNFLEKYIYVLESYIRSIILIFLFSWKRIIKKITI